MKVPTNPTNETWARCLGFLAGLLLMAAVLLANRVPPGDGRAAADVLFVAGPTGELAVAPTGPVLAATGLLPGQTAHGAVAITNQTGKRLRVTMRALPESPELDRLLRVRVRIGEASLFAGSLGDMRRTQTIFRLASGKTARLKLTAWLPRTTRLGSAGRVVSVPLELKSTVVA